jgi:lysophospholipase L1-like esterase
MPDLSSLEEPLFMSHPRLAAVPLRVSLFAIFALLCVAPVPAQTLATMPWVGTWATAPLDGDPWHKIPTVVGSTLREIVHTSIAGKALRIRFTNEFGSEPLRIRSASVALSAGESAIQPSTLHIVTFGGQPAVIIPPGAEVFSDPVDLATQPFADLTVSIFLPLQRISSVSVHPSAQQINYIQTGDVIGAPRFNAPQTTPSWYFVKGVDVQPVTPQAGAIVAFGDSITDGAQAAENLNHRWPDKLAVRLHNNPATANLSVLNEGIGGNCVLINRVGPNALARFDRDVLAQAGVRYVILLEGINDIGMLDEPNMPDYHLTAQDLEQGLSQLAVRAHEQGIKVLGATITPYQGAAYATETGEQIREAVNTWIRTSGVFDGVVDFDKATRDPAHPLAFASQYDSGDHLHPKDEGYAAMADSIDLNLFR